jgi:prepilin-type N-terminal cleavage/methylation domain-containing protein
MERNGMTGWREQNGFTLVELMVVVLVIGILVGVAIPLFNSAAASARRGTCVANQRAIEGAAQNYKAFTPGAVQPVSGLFNGNHTANTWDVLVHDHLKVAPKCPASKQYYWVEADGTVSGDTGHVGFGNGHAHY